MAESEIAKLMRLLQCTEEEAQDIIKTDKMIERGERTPYDLPEEKEKEAKKMANAGVRKPTVYNFTQRERKANPTKSGIIAELALFLEKDSDFATENVEITNKERQIAFSIGEERFELTLVQKRKAKS